MDLGSRVIEQAIKIRKEDRAKRADGIQRGECELARPVTACAGNRGLIRTMLNGGHVSGSRADDELLIAPPPRRRAAVSLTSSGIWPSRSLSRCCPPGSASATSSVHPSPTLAQRLGKRGRVVLLFSHERILAAGV